MPLRSILKPVSRHLKNKIFSNRNFTIKLNSQKLKSKMKKHFYVAIILVCIIFSRNVVAQQDAHFTQYMFNQLYFNPAAAGLEQGFRGGLLYRNQWTGWKGQSGGGAPQNILFTGSLPIMAANTGVGLVVNSDQIGPLTDLQASVNGAYHFKVGPGKLSAGIRVGIQSRSINGGDLKVNDTSDPIYQKLVGST